MSPRTKHRTTAVEKRQARSDVTRMRVIDAAIEEFGTSGFEGTSTRALAAKAGTNLTAIRYHFGGKEGLYRAAAERIAAGMRERLSEDIGPLLHVATAVDASEEELVAAICTLLDVFAAQVTGGVPDTWVTFVTREQLHPGAAFDVLSRTMKPFMEMLSNLVGRVIGQSGDSPEARLVALMLYGQVVVFRTHRAAALQALGWREYGAAQRRQLRAAITEHIAQQLRARAKSHPARTRASAPRRMRRS